VEVSRPNAGIVYRRVLPNSPFDVRIEIRATDRRKRFTISAIGHALPESIADMRGLSVTVDTAGQNLTLDLADDRLSELYYGLLEDLLTVLDRSKPGSSPVATVVERLTLWRRLFSESANDGLSPEEQRGLFCELICLRDVILKRLPPSDSVAMWKSPLRASQDFFNESVAIEVKSRFRKGNTHVRISSENQLVRGPRRLFLAVYALDSGSGCSLNALVAEILEVLSEAPVAQIAFADSLIRYGYIEVHRSRYDQTTYTASPSFFEVKEGFPMILPEALDQGVINVAYDLELVACVPFGTSHDEVLSSLGGIDG
jgi:hypothetical protein